ncbi:uncharacterized protein LOC112268853 isoform X2 [Brachypodium distachyon]|uniref:uncharacterized protein LOC112268853 isoform X2 n=1 Tax=Brachypodium distachyon TaxID=15368 RepID=UPI000D0D0303|nr:uncharacterized protein LOC112268853 isoform X2 [Brachypodium distachyon]|eukprot:XP_024310801.1 uncharacterized protein LOC112268853 isoform X2 [Brachypodium distachyon]
MSIMSANAASITRKYCASWLLKAEPRTSILSGFGWLQETIDTPGETYTMLRMSARVFFDLHDLLVERLVLCTTQVCYIMQLTRTGSSFRILQRGSTT